MIDINNFDAISIGLASSKQIRSWSSGEGTKPETINYRTLKPEKDGLFCERIFGPTKDWEGYCGKYKRVRYKGIVCERCGVEVTRSKVRRERMGHIDLAAPVSHIWFFKGVPSRIGYLLDMAPKELEKVLYFAASIVTWVDDDARQKDLPELETRVNEVLDAYAAEREERTLELRESLERRENYLQTGKQTDFNDEDFLWAESLDVKVTKLDDDEREKLLKELRKAFEADISDTEAYIEDAAERMRQVWDVFKDMEPKRIEHDETLFRELKERFGSPYGFGEYFRGGMGAEAIRDLLEQVDLDAEAEDLEEQVKTAKGQKQARAVKRLKVVDAFRRSGNRPDQMILEAVPVIPPELRPMVQLDGGRFATSDLNDLYRRVINRNNRLKRLLDLGAPEIIVNNEKRMLQEAVDALFDNGRRGRAVTGPGNRPLKSLSDMLKGKQGRFRQNLLGKRVDYSGRSVIVAGPNLKLHQCGLPKLMALELFKPFIMSRLVERKSVQNIKAAKKHVDSMVPEVWDVLEEVIAEHPVLLNRAPTLHRLGIQAFEPVLIEGKAIQLHPLVCAAFNADFDGDQMAVHVPLSLEAQLEARVLMMSTNNILHPANGQPIIVPSQDIVLGLYYLSVLREGLPGEGKLYGEMAEIEHALHSKVIHLHTKIKYRWQGVDENGKPVSRWYETTAGRAMLGQVLPKSPKMQFDVINKLMTKKEISGVIDQVYRHCGQKETVIFCDRIMALGFYNAFKAGISFGKDDMVVPASKWKIVEDTRTLAKEFEQQYNDGLITHGEKYNKVVDAWSKCTKKISEDMMTEISAVKKNPKGGEAQITSIYMMAHSGARGSPAQMRQLAGMRGLMAKPSGEIIETPIISNFKEGLSVLEYFNSTHGARKGLADTALKTANSGYLTRRLVDVAQDCIITQDDCGTKLGIKMRAIIDSGSVVASLASRILGRSACDDVRDPATGTVLVKRGTLMEEIHVDAIQQAGIQEVKIRSALTCELVNGICGKCYGRDLARGTPVNHGEAVGVIAAQSIGEPGTQLTMRTFHIGGAAQINEQSFVESNFDGKVTIKNKAIARNSEGHLVAMVRNMVFAITDADGTERATHRIQYGARVHVDEGDAVKRGQRIAEWDPYSRPVLTEVEGTIGFEDLVEGQSISETLDESTGIAKRVVIDWRASRGGADLRPAIVVKGKDGKVLKLARGGDARYMLSVDGILSVDTGAKVKAGDILARISTESAKTRDITGGLPRVAELFEARKPKDAAIIAEIAGTIRFGRDYKNKRRISIEPMDKTEEAREYLIPKGKHIHLQDGDIVEKGDFIVEGNPARHDILARKGIEELAAYLVNEIQEVYRLQGVLINDKHIEVIVRQMLQKVEIDDAGETELLQGEQVDRIEFDEINAAVV